MLSEGADAHLVGNAAVETFASEADNREQRRRKRARRQKQAASSGETKEKGANDE